MHLGITKEGMLAHAVARGELRARNWSTQQRFGGAAAILVKVVGLPIRGREAEIGLAFAAEHQLRIVENLALLR
jgi:hypothetical protein